jgi:hypothetical protein
MLTRKICALSLALLLGCRADSSRTEARGLAAAFFRGAAAGDSAALWRMSVDSVPAIRALTIKRLEPQLLDAASRALDAARWQVEGDTARLDLRFAYHGGTETVTLGIVRSDDRWRVFHLGVPGRQ